jgi:heat shock protein HspQ
MPRNNKNLYEKALVKAFDIKTASKALAYFVFREIIEDVHAEYNISQDEMKAMNRKAVNRAAAFLECFEDEERFASLVSLLSLETAGWDNPKETADTKRFLQAAEKGAEGLRKIKGKSAAEIYG